MPPKPIREFFANFRKRMGQFTLHTRRKGIREFYQTPELARIKRRF
ncbi:MAG: hypothetical protein HYW05_01665 [Candidatus Diapherotrites archaeon]|nr:hypothetical protein [Candidatus Diapherotrites archaeon]